MVEMTTPGGTNDLPSDPALMTAEQLLELYRRGRLSPVEALVAIEARIHEFGGPINAFVARNPAAMDEAKASETRWVAGRPRGILDGVPCTVKDMTDLQGFATRCGSRLTSDTAAQADAPAVIGLKNACAVIIGKTASTEFGWKAPGDSPHSGITRNPWNLDFTPGGSSSGAGAAGAACFGPLHTGTDGGGSIRVPAAWCGLVGLKPTYGRIAQWPLGAFAHVACTGPLARSSADAALMLSAMARADSRDPYCLPDSRRDWHAEIEKGVAGLRIAVMTGSGEYAPDAATVAAVEQARAILGDAGATLQRVELPIFELRDAFDREWGLALARVVASFPADERCALDPAMLLLAREHASMSAVDFLDTEIAYAHFASRMAAFRQDHDLLLCPTVPSPPPRSDVVLETAAQSRWTRWGVWTFPFNVSREPAISIPMGLDSRGMPTAVQIVGARYGDDLTLRAARVIERQVRAMAPNLSNTVSAWKTRAPEKAAASL